MAPIPLSAVDGRSFPVTRVLHPLDANGPRADLKDVIQHLFEIQSAVHGYLGPETQQELVRKMYVPLALACNVLHQDKTKYRLMVEKTSPSPSRRSAPTPPTRTTPIASPPTAM